MGCYNELIKHFPEGMTPRPMQEKILKMIAGAIDDDKRYVVLDAGTGIGKSAMAITVAKYLESAYVVTVTKQLQDQYANDFHIPLLKGRSNFTCLAQKESNMDATCDEGFCQITNGKYDCDYGITRKNIQEVAVATDGGDMYGFKGLGDKCEYWDQKLKAINSDITIMNYASYFPEMNYLPFFDNRRLAIFDEAHNLEDQVMKQIGTVISNRKLVRDFQEYVMQIDDTSVPSLALIPYGDEEEHWLREINGLIDSYKSLKTNADKLNLNNKKKGLIDNTIQNLERVENELRTRPNDWVVDVNEDTETIQFKPIDVARFCAPYFFDHTDVCMFMSATILNKRTFCKWHGIDAKDTCYIQQKSPFDIDRRPIFVKPVGSMAYKSIQNTKPRTIPEIKKIMAKHGNQKGLIHTNSHHLTKYLYEELNDPRVITYTKMSKYDRPNREEVINDFIASDEPLVLVAPSVDEGVDLPGDLCRFQVIYKIPFPDLSDKQIKARMKKDKKWYAYKTVTSLVQSYGRGMRKEDDYCDTYITDKDILSVMNDKWRKCVYFMPEYFTEAVQVCNEN